MISRSAELLARIKQENEKVREEFRSLSFEERMVRLKTVLKEGEDAKQIPFKEVVSRLSAPKTQPLLDRLFEYEGKVLGRVQKAKVTRAYNAIKRS